MDRLEGKVAVITGGIGLATAMRFARKGGRLILTGRCRCNLDAAVPEVGVVAPAVPEVGGVATGVWSDISNFTDLGLPRLARR